MKKLSVIICSIAVIVLFSGCDISINIGNPTQKPQSTEKPTVRRESPLLKATVAGVSLGNKLDSINGRFGDIVKTTKQEESGYYGTKVNEVIFSDKTSMIVERSTDKILTITVEDSKHETNFGIKTGDTLKSVKAKYGADYKLFKGYNSPDYITGWYMVEKDELMIFDFIKNDGSHYNENIDNSDKVISITLSNPNYFD